MHEVVQFIIVIDKQTDVTTTSRRPVHVGYLSVFWLHVKYSANSVELCHCAISTLTIMLNFYGSFFTLIWVRGRSRSLKMSPFDRPYTTSYWSARVRVRVRVRVELGQGIALSYTISCWTSVSVSVAIRKPPLVKAETALKKIYGEKRFSIWRMKFLHLVMWHDHDIDFAR